jgi:predicted dehydrogenase
LAEEVDGYVVCTETDRHVEWVEKLAAKGKPLFVEKPLGFAGADAVKMADAIEAAGVAFQTGYFSRSIPEIRQIKALVDSGALGQITRVRGSNCHSGALGRWFDTDWRWMADPKVAGVGAFGDLGTHSLDILLWIFGPAESVTGQLSNGTEAYEGDKLDTQLDGQAELFLRDSTRNRFDLKTKTAQLSSIFSWYQGDFGADKLSALRKAASYAAPEVRAAVESDPAAWKVEYLSYDWSLNAQGK